MKLVMFGSSEREASPGVILGDRIARLEIAEFEYPKSIEEILEVGLLPEISDYLENTSLKNMKTVPLKDAYIAAPLSGIGKVIACGLNYKNHAAEMGDKLPQTPLIFAKANSSIAGAREQLMLPRAEISDKIDWEIELGVVIGETCKDVSVENALNYAAGYVIALDITARDIQKKDGQWFRAKSFDGFCPLGEFILTRDELDFSDEIDLTLSVNGKEKQHGKLSDMIFNAAEIVSFVSSSMTLYAGDLILTGTPDGIGAGKTPPEFLKSGDIIDAKITNLGKIEIKVK